MHTVPLAATTRGYPETGYAVENIHHGSVAVVGAAGRLLWSAGDPDALTFTRSALKPFQALPFLLDDGPARFGLTRAEVALLCASHSGEEWSASRPSSTRSASRKTTWNAAARRRCTTTPSARRRRPTAAG